MAEFRCSMCELDFLTDEECEFDDYATDDDENQPEPSCPVCGTHCVYEV